MAITFDLFNKKVQTGVGDTTNTYQSLVNAVRPEEAKVDNLDKQKFLDAIGKADLGGGITSGVIMLMQNGWEIKAADQAAQTTVFFTEGSLALVSGNPPVDNTATNVTYVIGNSASPGLLSGTGGLTKQDVRDAMRLTSAAALATDSIEDKLDLIEKVERNRWKITGNQLIIYDDDQTTPLLTFDLKDSGGLPTETDVKERTKV